MNQKKDKKNSNVALVGAISGLKIETTLNAQTVKRNIV